MSHVVLSTIIFILLVTKTSSSPLDTTTPTQSQSEPSIDRVKNSKSIVLSLSVIAIVLIVSILAYVSLRNLEKLKPFISRTKMYLSFSSNIRRKNNNFSFVKLNTRLQSTGRNNLENLLNEKHNHGLQPLLPVSKLTTINTSSSKPFKLLPINFDIDADIFNIFLHQKSRQMFSISRWTAISDVVSPSHFQHNWLLPHPRFYREARHRWWSPGVTGAFRRCTPALSVKSHQSQLSMDCIAMAQLLNILLCHH